MSGNVTGVQSRVWTDEQLRAISVRGENMLVSAGAGSGKTAVLINRIVNLLADGADLSKMLISTFTVAAATDMKRKLAEQLAAAAADTGCDRSRVNNIADAVKKLPLAQICTLDSWCSHVVKSRFFISDLTPDFAVLDENEAKALKYDVCDRLIADELTGGDDTFAELYEVMLSRRSHERLVNAVLTAYDYAVAQPYPQKWLALSARLTDGEYRERLANPVLAQIDELCDRAEKLRTQMGAAGFAADYNALDAVIGVMKRREVCSVATPRLVNKPEFYDLHELYKQTVAEYKSLKVKLDNIMSCEALPPHGDSDRFCRKLAELALKLHGKYAEVKRSRSRADYADLEHQALKILNDPVYGKEITDGYTHVFVDEYQDISPLQEEILSKFGCEMFFVGDVKQSIYGFRMCRPDFFISKRDRYESGEGTAVSLNTNFRSGTAIIDAVNKVFSAVMTRSFGGTDYARDAIKAGNGFEGTVKAFLLRRDDLPDECEPRVYSPKLDGGFAQPELVKEAKAVTAQILNILDENSRGESAISYGDIAVLVRSRSPFTDALQAELRKKSIPVSFVASFEPADSFASVASVISMLRLINNTHDDVSMAAVLLSPMFGGFTPEQLDEVRKNTSCSFCDCIYADYEGDPEIERKLGGFKQMLGGFINAAARSTVAELFGIITGECDCFNYAVKSGGAREAAALDAFGEYLASCEPNDLFGAMRKIDRIGVPEIKVGDEGGAVKIMTIHSSKGLEFKHVILPYLSKQFNVMDTYADIICSESEGIVMRNYDVKNGTKTSSPRFKYCAARLKSTLVQEEMRLLYVAMTRAKEGLYLFSYPPEKQRTGEDEMSYIDWLYPYLFGNAELPCESEEIFEQAAPLREAVTQIADALTENFERNSRVKRTGSPVKVTVTEVAHGDETAYASFAEDAAARGTAYHKFMQWADFDSADAYGELCRKFGDDADAVDEVQIKTAFKKVGEFIGDRKYLREKQFVYNAPTDGGSVLVQGVIDLVLFNGDGSADIVDYKTGKEENVRKNEAYVKQLGLYSAAVEQILKIKVRKKYLYSFEGACFIEVDTK